MTQEEKINLALATACALQEIVTNHLSHVYPAAVLKGFADAAQEVATIQEIARDMRPNRGGGFATENADVVCGIQAGIYRAAAEQARRPPSRPPEMELA